MHWYGSPSTAGLLLAGALLLVNAGVSYRDTQQLAENDRWVAHTRHVLEAIGEVHASIEEAEAGQRGFLVTGDDVYLEKYEHAERHVQEGLRHLESVTADNPAQQRRAAALDALAQARLERLSDTIAVRREQGAEAAAALVASAEGRRLMERIRTEADAMKRVEDRLLAQRSAESETSLRRKAVTNAIGTLLGLAALGLAFVLFRRALAERASAEERARREAVRQAAIGELRHLALGDVDVDALMERATHLVAGTLEVPLVKVLELLPGGRALRLRAGVGWKEGRVGHATVSAENDSQAGYTLRSSRPVVARDPTSYEPLVVEDVRTETRFRPPLLLVEHGAVSGISVVIHGEAGGRPFGVLGAHDTVRRRFEPEEAIFVQAIANVLAAAIQHARAEEALRASEARFRALADSVPGFVWTSEPDGQVDYVNRHWYEWSGATAEDTEGMSWLSSVHPDDEPGTRDLWLGSMRSGEPFDAEYRLRRKDGRFRWCLARALPLRDSRGRVVKWFGSCMDIDDRKRVEAALKNSEREKDRFLATLGHELRNPLAPIVNAVELLKRDAGEDPESDVAWAVGAIDRQTRHMTRLIDDLLDASRISRGEIRMERRVVELDEVVTGAIELAQPLVESRRHKLHVSLPEEEIRLDGDPTRLIQSFGNLLSNAARYTAPGGEIRFEAGREDGWVVIRVRDNGQGIPADQVPHVFDLFYRAPGADSGEQARGGLGIGLALVRRLVELHGGQVEAASDGPGCGSEFRVRLPVASEGAAGRRAAEQGAAPRTIRPLPRSYRVLVVDDNALLAETFARLLRREGCETRTAGEAEEALRVARELRPEAIFLDVGLPGIDGYELARRLRSDPELRPTLLAAVTGYGQEEDVRRAREAGFDRHLVKPVEFDDVKELLRECCDTPAGP